MPLLERACVDYVRSREPERFNLPKRNKRIAILGAGLSGLACAQRLAAKKYEVTVFERSGEIGGSLKEMLPREIYLEELEIQFSGLVYSLRTEREIFSLEELTEGEVPAFDAVYIATGAGGCDFGLRLDWDPGNLATTREGVFLGGQLSGTDPVGALAQGLTAAVSIENYLKIGSMENLTAVSHPDECRIKPYENRTGIHAIFPQNGTGYSKEEALAEAAHCLGCDCTVCYDTCEYMKTWRFMPKVLEVKALSGHEATNQRFANRLIATCTLCGHCEAVCDFDASVEKVMRRGKQTLFEDGGFAPVYHDFYLRDFAAAMGEDYLCRPAPGQEGKPAAYAFFPGCQIAKTNPEYVLAPYRYMLANDADTALLLACCAVPALYAGDASAMRSAHETLRADLRALGDPVCVLACPTCAKTFEEFLPETRWISLWEYVLEKGLPARAAPQAGDWAVFDPCASRKFPAMQEAVRLLFSAAGLEPQELPQNKDRALCCGQGGHIYAANPELARKFAEAAEAQSALPYLTYCTNCRDIFLKQGKRVLYASDVFFGIEPLLAPVHIREKEQNRRLLKSQAQKEFWGETRADETEAADEIFFPEDVLRKMDGLLLSERDIREVIRENEEEKTYLVSDEKGERIASKRLGLLTIWAEYKIRGGVIDVDNVYCHRIEFVPE
jgi:Fe-S oxidoreductase